VNGTARDDLAHLLLDDRQVFGGERPGIRPGALEVVVETVFDHGADGHLRARPQLLHGFRHHVRCIMPDQLQRFGIVAGHDLDIGVRMIGSARSASSPSSIIATAFSGQRFGNTSRHVETGSPSFIGAHGIVGEGQGNHVSLLLTLCTHAGKLIDVCI
jgi:hypothetical protein